MPRGVKRQKNGDSFSKANVSFLVHVPRLCPVTLCFRSSLITFCYPVNVIQFRPYNSISYISALMYRLFWANSYLLIKPLRSKVNSVIKQNAVKTAAAQPNATVEPVEAVNAIQVPGSSDTIDNSAFESAAL